MNQILEFTPFYISPPGDSIRQLLTQSNYSVSNFAIKLNREIKFVENLLNGNEEINLELAKTLENIFEISEDYWMSRQLNFNLQILESNEIIKEKWIKFFPFIDLQKFGWIQKSSNQITTILDFFNVPNFVKLEENCLNKLNYSLFKKSYSFKENTYSTICWINYGEKIANKIVCKDWDEEKLEEKLNEIKFLSKKKNPKDFLPLLVEIFAECGVAFVIAKTPTGCRASGLSRFLSEKKAMILLSFRYLTDDQFWFTLFHEIGHLILHKNNLLHLDDKTIKIDRNQVEEFEANIYAQEALIPEKYNVEFSKLKGNKRQIIEFANLIGISPGIVVGQMQFKKIIDYSYLNKFKRKYDWEQIMEVI